MSPSFQSCVASASRPSRGTVAATGEGSATALGAASVQSAPLYDAVLVDVGGTLLKTAEPVHDTYAAFAGKYGVTVSADEIKKGFRRAFAEPWPHGLRYEGDGRPFWRHAVAIATGSDNQDLFEDLYQHYEKAAAWRVADGAVDALLRLRQANVRLAIVSNFDSRLRPILQDLQVDSLFDAIVVSAEVKYEKPSPEIFSIALEQVGVSSPSRAVHVGDDAVNDLKGAMDAGLHAWLWKQDVNSFDHITQRVLGL
ncbi:hypothetical protein CLOP_g37 [Closterium sp. NIES-67]|nr:hypothetical protein CLOP_g37 [Closterium sp. NIES-67]